jgi:hypothetical protein
VTAAEEARQMIVSAPFSGGIAKSLASPTKVEITPPLSSPKRVAPKLPESVQSETLVPAAGLSPKIALPRHITKLRPLGLGKPSR